MSEPILNMDGGPTILTTDALKMDVAFTNVDDMIEQQVAAVLDSRKDWKREDKFVQDVETRARDFFGKHREGDRLCWFQTGGGLSMRAGLVILRGGRAAHAWIQMMS